MRGRLLQGWLQPTQIPLYSKFPSWKEFNHTNWQAFTLVFFLSSVTITISFSAGEPLTCIPSKQGKKKKSMMELRRIAPVLQIGSAMLQYLARQHGFIPDKMQSISSLVSVILSRVPNMALQCHLTVQGFKSDLSKCHQCPSVPSSKLQGLLVPHSAHVRIISMPNLMPLYICLYHCTQVFVTSFEDLSDAPQYFQ